MRTFRITLLILVVISAFTACQKPTDYTAAVEDGHYFHRAQTRATEVMIHDIFSPPVATRIYTYASLAAYEVAAASDPVNYVPLLGQLNGSEPLDLTIPHNVYPPLAALAAYYQMSTALIFSEDMMHLQRDKDFAELVEKGIPEDVFEASVKFGQEVAEKVKDYSKKDNYHQSRSFPKYTVISQADTWQPTPPAYMEAVEPHWSKIRTFVLDSAAQFKALPPPPFSTDPNSDFFKMAKEVYDAKVNMTDQQLATAMFWDCNPYKMNVKGHVMFAEKKITPGGHWMSIASIASKASGKDWKGTVEAYALTAISLNEAFISCWDEKYRTRLIRPETYINQYIDEEWVPVLQTPPFPEYTSGHSVASTAAAFTLVQLFGDELHIVDSSEVAYGLPVREFDGFTKMAEEAALSRLYGGIHYMSAITQGSVQGRQVGELISQKISTKPDKVTMKD